VIATRDARTRRSFQKAQRRRPVAAAATLQPELDLNFDQTAGLSHAQPAPMALSLPAAFTDINIRKGSSVYQ
jgi:hypothetical protein